MIDLYEYIKGRVVKIKDDYVIIDNGGIGYRVFTSRYSINNMDIGDTLTMYLDLNLREDGIYLYGFTSEEELKIFNMLRLVSKIGPKVALNILSTLTPNEIKSAIYNNDIDSFVKVPGIGKKTANRIVLELKDRIKGEDIISGIVAQDKDEDNLQIAIEGMMSLGYTKGEVLKVVKDLDISQMDAEQIIREALKRFSK
ncbi:MAG: Holliday junction branch migration protein RuvA [Tissierellia bacterium]|nr:Holliday junction branch migration protein RuvA [Tissierellia bacterium]